MGSGSLLLNIRKYVDEPTKVMYYGQEINTATYNLARMNMIIHHIPQANQHLRNADTLDADWPTDEITVFDGCVMKICSDSRHRTLRLLPKVQSGYLEGNKAA